MKKIGILPCVSKIELDTIERLAQEYSQTVSDLGFIPFILPHTQTNFKHFVTELDAFIVTGSAADIDPQTYKALNTHSKNCNLVVDQQELEFISLVAKAQKPLLGICRGMQLMNVFASGTLQQDISDSSVNHNDYQNQTQIVHSIEVNNSRYLPTGEYLVNSIHHQAIKTLGTSLIATGKAPDGIIEMIEHEELPWLGVQWHCEFKLPNPDFKKIYNVLNA